MYSHIQNQDNINIELYKKIIKSRLEESKNNNNDYSRVNQLSFAWEPHNDILETAKILSDFTEILIVIGYSFPFFNCQIDRDILRAMRQLKKVYIQDINPTAAMERFQAILPDFPKENIIPITSVDQFYLPHELVL